MSNLVIDIGNTFTKLGIFDNETIIKYDKVESKQLEKVIECIGGKIFEYAIISNIGYNTDFLIKHLSHKCQSILSLSHHTPLPITNKYKSPQTLGLDRIATAVGAYATFPNSNCIIIDAGTCITYDVLTSGGEYLGGNIAPGKEMRLKSMHEYTQKLPLVTEEYEDILIGYNTKTAIWAGVTNGIKYEIEGYFNTLSRTFTDLNIILTGGDALFISKSLKRKIFLNQNLALVGLNKILRYNAY